ncbi:MAG: SDR family oxidoreductase [Alphaproteobacteria bacterium]|nr:SDR family oxidoreductase [Alphaproteobacteria bacterium]
MRTVAITGVSGGIGQAMGRVFREASFRVIGIDAIEAPLGTCDHFISADLAQVGRGEQAAQALADQIGEACNQTLNTLINNAAVQHLGDATTLDWAHWRETLDVNLGAPFALARALHAIMAPARGNIINIGSVHATATKPGFSAYATSKAALHGLTRALALDFGSSVRVMTLAPAAVDTPMLRAGFEGNDDAFAELETTHPVSRIAQPEEIAKAALYLSSEDATFMTGATLQMDGGILARLHDPA